VGTLSSELGPVADQVDRPRIYADANVPAGLVQYMRVGLAWDVLFVLEHPELRRARDREHYRLARQLRRTLVTLDRDYLDDRAFPPRESPGVLVVAALLARLNQDVFRVGADGAVAIVPLEGRKLHVHPDWTGE
jgi:hypothetical protein